MIFAANGTPVHNVAELAAILQQIGIGNTVRLTVLRNGQAQTIDVRWPMCRPRSSSRRTSWAGAGGPMRGGIGNQP